MSSDTVTVESVFRQRFSGEVITPEDSGYHEARQVWNAMCDTRPQLIARCRTVEDIVSAVEACGEVGVAPAVRAGGHSVAGLSTCDGVVIDVSPMRGVRVDPSRRVAVVEPGATWADFDAAAAVHGLATTGGLISTTGVAGLTLGGGIGWLQRRYGLACDNLAAADVVLASGETVRADPTGNPELLWGLRGGGGNFGVVSSFEFTLHDVSTVYAGMLMFDWARAEEVLAAFRDWTAALSDDASMLAAVMTAPPESFIPEHLAGQPVIAIVGCWCGDLDAGAEALQPMRDLVPTVDLFGPIPYPALQSMLDGGGQPGARNYFKTGFLETLDTNAIAAILEHGGRLSSPMSQIHLHQMGGAVARPDSVGSAFTSRDAGFTYNLVTTWLDAEEDSQHIEATRVLASALAPSANGRVYVNFLDERTTSGVRAAYDEQTYARLSRLKRRYDPDNMFRHNHNVLPAAS
jgi:FAD/FMN-containing dehydrogenase